MSPDDTLPYAGQLDIEISDIGENYSEENYDENEQPRKYLVGGDDGGIIEGIVPNLIIKPKHNKEAVNSGQQVDPPPRPTGYILPSSALGVDLLQHIDPTREEDQHEDGEEEGLNEDAEEIRLENPNKVVRIVEEDDGNGEVDHHTLLCQNTAPIFEPKTIDEKTCSEYHNS